MLTVKQPDAVIMILPAGRSRRNKSRVSGESRSPLSAAATAGMTSGTWQRSSTLGVIQEGRTSRSNICESYKNVVLPKAIRDSAGIGKAVQVPHAEFDVLPTMC